MNDQLFNFFHNLAHRSEIFDKLVVFLAVYFPYVVVILAGLFILFHHEVFKAENPLRFFLEKKKEMIKVFFSGALALLIAVILKLLFHIPRPVFSLTDVQPLIVKTTFSFPSEHASFFMALAISIFLLHKRAGYIFMFFALVIGVVRITAGVHFPIDILGGYILGIFIASLIKNV